MGIVSLEILVRCNEAYHFLRYCYLLRINESSGVPILGSTRAPVF